MDYRYNCQIFILINILQSILSYQNNDIFASKSNPAFELKSIFVLLRHGDRTPTSFYPNDPFKNVDEFWPDGSGELNENGRLRIKFAGNYYRQYYDKLFSNNEKINLQCLSSPSHRAQETAMIFMENLLDSTTDTFEIIQNGPMLSTGSDCPLSVELWQNEMNSDKVRNYIEKNREFIEYLSNKTGLDYFANSTSTLRNLEFLATTLEIERDEYHLDVPKWAKSIENIEKLHEFKRHAFLFDWEIFKVQRLRIGLLLNEIIENIQNNDDEKRFFLYSSHDVNQVLLLQALNLYDQVNNEPPFYCSGIIIEHYRSNNNDDDEKQTKDFIRIIFRQILNNNNNDIDGKNHRFIVNDQILKMKFCDSNNGENDFCHFDEFVKFTQKFCIENEQKWQDECHNNNSISQFVDGRLILIILLLTILKNLIML